MRLALLLIAVFAVGCAPEHVTPPPGVGACEGACSVLAELECPEGLDPECVPGCERVAGDGTYLWTDASSGPLCVIAPAQVTVESVRACNVRCLR